MLSTVLTSISAINIPHIIIITVVSNMMKESSSCCLKNTVCKIMVSYGKYNMQLLYMGTVSIHTMECRGMDSHDSAILLWKVLQAPMLFE